MEPFKLLLLVLATFSFVWFAIPTLMQAAHNGRFFDAPDHERKVHVSDIPNLGGIGIFFGFLFGCILFLKAIALEYSNFLLGASMIIFAMGIRDDLMGLNAYVKVFIQFLISNQLAIFSPTTNFILKLSCTTELPGLRIFTEYGDGCMVSPMVTPGIFAL